MFKSISRPVMLIAGFSLFVALVFALDVTPWVRGGYGWRWQYVPVDLARILPLILCTLLYLAGAWYSLKYTIRPVTSLLWAMTGAAVLAVAVAYSRDGNALYTLFVRTASLTASAEHWGGAQIDWAGGEWRDWLGVMQRLGNTSSHMATSPPGIPMLYGLTTHLVSTSTPLTDTLHRALLPYQCHNNNLLAFTPAQWASAWLGILSPVWAAFAVFPIYGIAKRLTPENARETALWWALVPGILAFATSISTIFPALAALAMWLLMKGLTPPPNPLREGEASNLPSKDSSSTFAERSSRHYLWIFAAGVVYGATLFLNFATLPLAGLYGFYTLLHYVMIERQQGVHWSRPLVVGLIFGAGILVPWVIFYLLTSLTFFDLLRQSLGYHMELERPYWFWVWMHVWDWLIWTGLGIGVLWLIGLVRRRGMIHHAPNILGWALLFTVLTLTASGITRGESGRIWLFLSPFALISGMQTLYRLNPSKLNWLVITASQAVLMIALTANLEVYSAPDLQPPPLAPIVSVSQPANVTFRSDTDLFRLTGWEASADDESITLNLQWQGINQVVKPYWFAAVMVSPSQQQFESQPWGESPYPTTCWLPGQTIGDTVILPLPENAEPGEWWISLAAFGDDTQFEGRLTTIQPDGTQDIQVGLGPITVK